MESQSLSTLIYKFTLYNRVCNQITFTTLIFIFSSSSDSLCIKCVQEQCRRIRFETRLSEDYKFVSDTLKSQQSNR